MKILIVDDESLARDVLVKQLNHFEYLEILTAGSGKEELELLARELPDLVFLDICMPEMSGIAFMEQAKALHKQFIYIILSGFNKFEYAQRTMELGAYKYLLKPIDDRKLKEAMDSAEEKLRIMRFNKEKYAELNKSRARARDLLKRQYIYDLISGNSSNSEKYEAAFSGEPVQFHKNLFQICCLIIKDRENQDLKREDQEIVQFGIENITNEIAKMNEMDAYFFSDKNRSGILMNYDQRKKGERLIYQQLFDQIQHYISCFKQAEVTFGVGREVQGLDEIQKAYTSARDTVNKRLILGGGVIYFAADEQANSPKNRDEGQMVEESIIKSLYQGDRRQIKKYIDDLYTPFISL